MRDQVTFDSTIDPVGESDVGWSTQSSEPGPADDSAAAALTRATQQFGRFRLLRLLGQGGMGVVHAAYDGQLDRVVALKMVRGDRGNTTVIARFIREAKALAKLSHPNVVQIFDVSTLRGDVFLAMEYVRGRTLREEMAARRRQGDVAGIVDLFLQAGGGLAAVHAAGLVHRDFKPDNVMVGDDGRVRVMDFGLARASDAPATALPAAAEEEPPRGEVELTAVGSVVGTPAYMSPEQHRGDVTDARSDVFSFCAALYEGLFGAPPFAPGHYGELKALAPAGARAPEVKAPGWLRGVVLRGLRVDPAERWPALGPLLAALAADPVAARRRARRRFGLGLAIAALAVAATAGLLALQRGREQARAEALAAQHLAAVEAHARPEEVEAAFQVFIADPAHQDTRALAQAWRGHGERRRAAGDIRGALASYGRAYGKARDDTDAQAAMRAIAELSIVDDQSDGGLGRALDALDVTPDDGPLLDLVVDAHLRRRDLARATTLLDGAPAARLAGAQPVLAALTRGRALALKSLWLTLLPDGPDAVAAIDPTSYELVVLDRALAPVRRWRSDRAIYLVPGSPWAVTVAGAEARLFDVRAPERTLALLPTPSEVFPKRFFAGGLYFLHASPVRGFKVLPEPGAPVRAAHAPSEAAGSDFEAMTVADLDGDGVPELVAAFGAFYAYDLRVFHALPSGELELLGRRSVGRVQGLTSLRRPDGGVSLAVPVDAAGTNDEVFPEPPHRGAEPGIYLFDWTGGELVERAYVPPMAGVEPVHDRQPMAADLDGDGREELVAPFQGRGDFHTLVVRQTGDGGLQSFALGHTHALAAGQLDDDPAHELFVADPTDSAVWVLGLGDEPRPPVASLTREPVTPPPELRDESLLARLARADELDAVGLPGNAAEVVRDAAALVADAPVRRRLLDRAARLFVAAGEVHHALELGPPIEDDPALAGAALMRRVELLTELGRFAEAVAAAERLREVATSEAQQASATAALTRLRPLLDEARAIELGFAGPLDPAWRIERPAALRRDPASASLQVAAVSQQGALASLPIAWDGGPIQLEIDLDVRRAEHNTGLHIDVVDAEGRAWLAVGLAGGGLDRGEGRHHALFCQPVGLSGGLHIAPRTALTAVTRHRMIARIVYFPDRATTECVVDDDELQFRRRFVGGTPPPPGLYTLRLGNDGGGTAHIIAADVRSISVRGARLDRREFAGGPAATAARALVDGEPLAVLSALVAAPGDPPGRALLELLAHDDLGDLRGVEASASRALAGLDLPDRIHLLRTRPGLAARVREASGAELPGLLAATWHLLAQMHSDDPAVQRDVIAGLRGIEGLVPEGDADREALGLLLGARATIHQRLGDADRAWRDREAGLAVLAASADPRADSLRAPIHEALAVSLAAVDPARALHHATEAIARNPSPELVRERLGRHGAVAELAAREPTWRELIDPRP